MDAQLTPKIIIGGDDDEPMQDADRNELQS